VSVLYTGMLWGSCTRSWASGVCGSFSDPLADRRQRGRSGQYGACGEGEYGESVAHTARVTRVRDLGQAFQQARDLPRGDRGLLPELVKGRRDQG
jgi:hypothetical protein